MRTDMSPRPSRWMPVIALSFACAISAHAVSTANPASPANPVGGPSQDRPGLDRAALVASVNATLGLRASDLIRPHPLGDIESGSVILPLEIEGVPHIVSLWPHSVRSANYKLLVQTPSGRLVPFPSGPDRTVRGTILGVPGSIVSGAVLDDGLHLRIERAQDRVHWLEPIRGRVADSDPADHVIYDQDDLLPTDRTCAAHELPEAADENEFPPPEGGDAPPQGGDMAIKIAQLACDADYEFYQAWGSVAGVENRIASIVNTINVQYELEVGVTHQISTIIVRTSPNQPYTHTDPQQLLSQFRAFWNANHVGVPRHVAHLFTGKNLDGTTIGIAWVGVICNLNFAYGLSQSNFSSNFACVTDLTSHELGHNWNSGHCSCSGYTMNPSITCKNTFHPTLSVPVIVQFRDTRTCLDDDQSDPPPPPPPPVGACCVNGTCLSATEAECAAAGGAWLGAGTSCESTDCGCPDGQIKDCYGNCAPASWATDGVCDNGSRTYNGVAIHFDCDEYACDGGACNCDPDPISVAVGDHSTALGSVTGGSFASTHTANGQYQTLREQESSGPPVNRTSLLQHTWLFDVPAGSAHVFGVSAHHSSNSENDSFVFSYSLNNSSFTPMLTVWKTAPDDQYQTFVFAHEIAGSVYIRVEDTDRTPGNKVRDYLYVDSMYIFTVSGDEMPMPLSPPSGVVAGGGDGTVTVSWNAVNGGGVIGYRVFRSATSGGPYLACHPAPISATSFVDSNVINGMTYHYVVKSVNADGHESTNSAQASATPMGAPTAVYVGSIAASAVNIGSGHRRGKADVVVLNSLGQPVAGVIVTVVFSGQFNETQAGVTASNGVATILSNTTVKGNPSFEVCVTDVLAEGLLYAEESNVVQCASN